VYGFVVFGRAGAIGAADDPHQIGGRFVSGNTCRQRARPARPGDGVGLRLVAGGAPARHLEHPGPTRQHRHQIVAVTFVRQAQDVGLLGQVEPGGGPARSGRPVCERQGVSDGRLQRRYRSQYRRTLFEPKTHFPRRSAHVSRLGDGRRPWRAKPSGQRLHHDFSRHHGRMVLGLWFGTPGPRSQDTERAESGRVDLPARNSSCMYGARSRRDAGPPCRLTR
jgi:hypothetical protein